MFLGFSFSHSKFFGADVCPLPTASYNCTIDEEKNLYFNYCHYISPSFANVHASTVNHRFWHAYSFQTYDHLFISILLHCNFYPFYSFRRVMLIFEMISFSVVSSFVT